jgi:hypothetical protein
MRHCDQLTVEQLLSVRDAQPVDATLAQHAAECVHCQAQLLQLRTRREALHALPELQAPPLKIAAMQSIPAHGKRMWAVAAGLGAVVVVSVAMLVSFQNQSSQLASQLVVAQQSEPLSEPSTESGINALVEHSQELEALLAMLPQSSSIERAGTATTIDELQARIQWLDFQLSVAGEVGLTERQATELWQDRVGLLDALVKVKYADTSRMAML